MNKESGIVFFKRLTLQRKATLGALMIVVLCIGAMSALSILQMNRFASRDQDKSAHTQIEGISLACQLPMDVGDYDEVKRILKSVLDSDDQIISCNIYDNHNQLIASVFNEDSDRRGLTYEHMIKPVDMDLGLGLGFDQGLGIDDFGEDSAGSNNLYTDTSDSHIGRIELKLSTDAIMSAQRDQIISTLTIGFVFGVIALLIGSVIVKRELARLDTLVAAADTLSKGDYTHQTPFLGNDEIGELGWVFERMRLAVEHRGMELKELNESLQFMVEEQTRDLLAAMQAATEANNSKTDFLANMSHEIRTPMTAILGCTELLDIGGNTEHERQDYIKTIQRNGEFLLSIINDILDITKVEAGKMTIERIECDLAVLIEEVMSLMRVRSQAKDIELELEYATKIPRQAMIDPLRTRQIMTNLVGNAIKFTDQGSVKIVVGCDPIDGTVESPLWVEIHDTGIGISPEQLDKLFNSFQQADSTMTRRYGGSGLGLCISKSLATLQGGDVSARSIINQGSVFTLRLDPGVSCAKDWYKPEKFGSDPNAHTESTEEITSSKKIKPLIGIRILLAEDGPDNQRLISHVLKKAGASITVANNGRIAVDEFNQALSTPEPFDLILMDMQMPEMDGYTATALLRKQGHSIPVIALTAHAMTGDRQRCLDAGCDEYSTKPINRLELIAKCKIWASFEERRSA